MLMIAQIFSSGFCPLWFDNKFFIIDAIDFSSIDSVSRQALERGARSTGVGNPY